MIPYNQLNQRAANLLLEYLREEISRALSERRPLEEKWLRYQRLYKAQPEKQVKEFPFYGASNLVIPVIATDVDTIDSRLMGILFGPENLYSTRPLREDAIDYAPRLQEFLKWAQGAELGTYRAVADFIIEMCKLGTGVVKERYRRDQRLVYEFRETPGGTLQRMTRAMLKDSPEQSHVSLYDFLVPAGTIDHQTAPWNAERIMLSWNQLQQRVRAGIYLGSDRLQAWNARDKGSWLRQEVDRMQSYEPSLASQFELWEVWVDFDIGGFGEPVPLVCTLHLPSMTYLRIDYNPFFHQEKPYSVARYLRQEKQFYGIGIAELLEMFQEEATAMNNQRIDNATLMNSAMMKARSGSGIREDEPIFPGRWFIVKEMEDIAPLQFGQLMGSTIGDEQHVLSYAQRRTGVNDYVMGNSSAAVGYAAAQTNIMQHQEAAKRFDQTLREVRVALGESGRRVTELYQQFNQGGKPYLVMGDRDGEVVNRILQFPLELIRHSVAIEVTATSAALNKETQIRTNTILMQMVAQFYQQMFQMMQMAISPQMPPQLRMLAERAVIGGATLMRRTLDSYDMQDVAQIIPDMQEILYGQQQQLAALGVPADPSWAAAGQALGGGGAVLPGAAMGSPGLLALPAGVA